MLNNSKYLTGGTCRLFIVLGYFTIFLAILSMFFGYYLKMWLITSVLALAVGALYFSWLILFRKEKENVKVKFHFQIINSVFILTCFLIVLLGIL